MVRKKVAKIIFAGDPSVGKTSIITRLKRKGDIKNVEKTKGICIESMIVDDDLEIVFWDFSGQVHFRDIVIPFFDGANVAIFVFDLSNPETLYSLINQWKDYLLKYAEDAPVLLIGNKKDIKSLSDDIIEEAIENLKRDINIVGYIETSALTNENLEKLYWKIIELAYEYGKEI